MGWLTCLGRDERDDAVPGWTTGCGGSGHERTRAGSSAGGYTGSYGSMTGGRGWNWGGHLVTRELVHKVLNGLALRVT